MPESLPCYLYWVLLCTLAFCSRAAYNQDAMATHTHTDTTLECQMNDLEYSVGLVLEAVQRHEETSQSIDVYYVNRHDGSWAYISVWTPTANPPTGRRVVTLHWHKTRKLGGFGYSVYPRDVTGTEVTLLKKKYPELIW